MMEAISGLVTAASLSLALVIGIRLLRRSQWRPELPEFWLGIYFVGFLFLGAAMSCSLYIGWSDPELALGRDTERWIHAIQYLPNLIGGAGLLIFIQSTFRSSDRWALWLVGSLVGLQCICVIMLGISEGYEVRVMNGVWYWGFWFFKQASLTWLILESAKSWTMSRKRLSLGLSEPIVSNRFMLWTIWATLQFALAFSDPIARFWYVSAAGSTTHWDPVLGRPMVMFTVAFSSGGLALASTALILTFFPSERYRRWISKRAASTA